MLMMLSRKFVHDVEKLLMMITKSFHEVVFDVVDDVEKVCC